MFVPLFFCHQEFLRAKIRAKFKNARHSSNDEKLEEERAAKRIRLTQSKKKQSETGLPEYDPGLKEPSDSQLEKMYLLKDQHGSMDEEKKKALKKETYPVRRWYLLKTSQTLNKFQTRFPWLFEEDEVRIVVLMWGGRILNET